MAAAEAAKAQQGTRFGKKANLRAPYVNWREGVVVVGRIKRKFEEPGKFGPKQVVELELIDPLVNPPSARAKEGAKPTQHKAGDVVRLNMKPGCATVFTYPEGLGIRLECTGKVPTDKGNDAWTFECETE